MSNPLLVALDVETAAGALALADRLRGIAGGFKIGSRLFTAEGPRVVSALVDRGDRVFLDLKFHDIPNIVAAAVHAAAAHGVWMLTIHASGGARMMTAAAEAARESAARMGRVAPLVIGVTVLTSMSEETLAEVGGTPPVTDQVRRLARLAQASGLDGVVASPLETAALRRECGEGFAIVTPGIRGGGAAVAQKDDQERTMSPREAIDAGASYLVVGRPITAATDPISAAQRIAAEIEQTKN